MLARAIRNLVDNATVHATARVDVVVAVTDRTASIGVGDDGPGVPVEHQATIFERFGRIDQSRARDGRGGAGLGLAIVSEVAMAHGGSVAVATSDLGGALFTLSLPLADGA